MAEASAEPNPDAVLSTGAAGSPMAPGMGGRKATVEELRVQAHDLQKELIKVHAQEVHDEAIDSVNMHIQELEERLRALEERMTISDEKAAAAAADDRKQKLQSSAMVAMLGGSNKKSKAVEEMADNITALAQEMMSLRATVQQQSGVIVELHADVARLTDLCCHLPEGGATHEAFLGGAAAPGPPVGKTALPPGHADLAPAVPAASTSGTTTPTPDPVPAAAAGAAVPPSGAAAAAEGGASALDAPSADGSEAPGTAMGTPHRLPTPGSAPHLRAVARASPLPDLLRSSEELKRYVQSTLEAAGLLHGAGYPAGKGPMDQKLSTLEEKLRREISALEAATKEAREESRRLGEGQRATEARLVETMSTVAAQQKQVESQGADRTKAMDEKLAALEAEKASKFEFEALTDAMRETRAEVLVASGAGGGDAEALGALQAAQQNTQGHVLSLQTHLRSLLRKAEVEKASAVPTVDISMIDDLKSELQQALSEVQDQLTHLHNGKADAERVEAALETKAERYIVSQKVDRAFCESLLSRFAVEVGRQLGDMEQSQTSIKESLEEAIIKLMGHSSDSAVAQVGRERTDILHGTGSAEILKLDMDEAPAAPFAVKPLRAQSAGHARGRVGSAGRTRGSAPQFEMPAGKGVLALSLFTTGHGTAPQPSPQQYAFQPRRPAGLMTPGEQQLVRQRPRSSAGRLLGASASAGLLSGSGPAGGGAGGHAAANPGRQGDVRAACE